MDVHLELMPLALVRPSIEHGVWQSMVEITHWKVWLREAKQNISQSRDSGRT